MTFYPPDIAERCSSVARAGFLDDPTSLGTAASFVCGSFTTLFVRIDDEGTIVAARFQTNGCGFMIATADVICEWLEGKSVTDLHGLDDLSDVVSDSLDAFPNDRVQCASVVVDALRKGMAEYRERRVAEFRGEVALICTCFGVSEDTIVDVINSNEVHEVDDVSAICRAGSGCGSCRMLIMEMIDARA